MIPKRGESDKRIIRAIINFTSTGDLTVQLFDEAYIVKYVFSPVFGPYGNPLSALIPLGFTPYD